MTSLPVRHLLLALAVVAVWGTNFVVIKAVLAHVPPFLMAALRFAFAAFPALLFIRRPPVPWHQLAQYGLLIGVGQFGVLYFAMRESISPGLASLVVQTQVFFTIALAIMIAKERVARYQWIALAMAAGGIAVIATHTDGATTSLGVMLVLVAAFMWALANLVSKRAGAVDMLGYVVWSSLFAVPPLLILSWWLDGTQAIVRGLQQATLVDWAGVLWQSAGNTLFGYGAWAWLLARHPAATITPMALLVPVFGMATAAIAISEPMPAWKLGATALVLGGLALNLLWPRVRKALTAR
jgi:O-acetylserine/cysteine efflux transporter